MIKLLLTSAICYGLAGVHIHAEDAAVSKDLFLKSVWATLEAKCFKCHGETKQKSELRLDKQETAFKGGESKKPGIVAGDTAKSQITVRINLPEDHDDVMPPKKPFLTKEEKEAINKWVQTGAVWEAVKKPVKVTTEQKISLKVPPPDPASLKALQDEGVIANTLSNESNVVSVDFLRVSKKVTDKNLASLKRFAQQLVWLNLANTGVTDAGLVHLKELKHLTRLHLEKTGVGDAGIANLAALAKLEYLNLYGTKVTDKGLATISKLPNLKAIYLWQTKVTDNAADAFRKSHPNLMVDTGWRLPADMPIPQKPKTVQVWRAPQAPKLDGKLDDAVWKTAATIDKFLLLGDAKNKPKAKTIGKLTYDDKFFYVGAICEETGRKDPFIAGGPPYGDDCIEIWMDANSDGQTFHQLVVNANAISIALDPSGPIEFPAQSFGQKEPGKRWILEVAVPYTSLGVAAPKPGQKWKFNLARNRPKGDKFKRELITWNPLQTRFKELNLFGTLVFGTTPPAKPVNTKCPVTGKPVNAAHTFTYKGKLAAFCCANCLAKFKKEPDKFIAKVKP